MKQIPILFSTQMVQALLAGRKTMTRRTRGLAEYNVNPDNWEKGMQEAGIHALKNISTGITTHFCSPFGVPGDILYGRETFACDVVNDSSGTFHDVYRYKADYSEDLPKPLGWKPSIHMPKSAARLWDEVVSVRLERLHEISEADAIAEGVQPNGDEAGKEWFHYMRDFDDFPAGSAVESFESLWESINGRESWDANPWVWVVEFKVLSTTGKPEHL